MINEDANVIEERKKKFGNSEAILTLDDEINKTKHIKKFQKNNNGHKFNKHRGGQNSR